MKSSVHINQGIQLVIKIFHFNSSIIIIISIARPFCPGTCCNLFISSHCLSHNRPKKTISTINKLLKLSCYFLFWPEHENIPPGKSVL
ncbi:hypothetical protein Hanom_Chr00s000186g01627661 [Helianthus anomalus]